MKTKFDQKTLIKLRRENYWTQEDLAAASGVSTRTIQRIERNGGGSPETWKAFAAAFDVDLRTLGIERGSGSYHEFNIRLGYMGMGAATALAIGGCFVPWNPILNGLNRGDSLAALWPFFILAAWQVLFSFVVLTWSWRRLTSLG